MRTSAHKLVAQRTTFGPRYERATKHRTLDRLQELLRRVEGSGQRPARDCISSGCPPLDRLLPQHGLLRGSLAEWLADGPGCGAGTLAVLTAREACREGGVLVVVDAKGTFYPPCAVAWGMPLSSTFVVRPPTHQDELWAIDQALRCEHVAAVLAWPRRIDDHTFRRWQLAAEASGCLGLLVRPSVVRREPSWADVRLFVSPVAAQQGRRLHVQLLRCRGRFGEGAIELEINERTGEIDEAHAGRLAPQLARSAAGEHSA